MLAAPAIRALAALARAPGGCSSVEPMLFALLGLAMLLLRRRRMSRLLKRRPRDEKKGAA